MGMREIYNQALKMKIDDKSPQEIRRHVERSAVLLGLTTGGADDRLWSVTLVNTQETIRFDGTDYSYKRGNG